MKKLLTILAAATALSVLLAAAPVVSDAAAHNQRGPAPTRTHTFKPVPRERFVRPTLEKPATLRDVRRATAKYRSVKAVVAAGYADDVVPGCFSNETGGMGVHYIDASSLNNEIDPLNPEAIVYEVGRNGRLTLVGVEYVVPPSDEYPVAGPAPTLFGQDFTMHPTLGVWKLHAWIWRPNPTGMFADYNPNVKPCPEEKPATLWDVRRATAKYRSVKAVVAAGYANDVVPGCFSSDAGGMGVHYIDGASLDDTIDALHPEAIVYEEGRNGRLTLVGVEYVVPPTGDYPATGTPPTLFGQDFTMHPTLGVWKLHAWIWRPNPTGMFADYNPDVKLCTDPV